jgi:hypothetical protein
MEREEAVTYGHRLFGNFKPLLTIKSEGFEYKGGRYQWSDIEKLKRYDSLFWSLVFYQAGTPLAYIFLRNGERIRIRGRVLEREAAKSNVAFVRGATSAYDELMELIQQKLNNAV